MEIEKSEKELSRNDLKGPDELSVLLKQFKGLY
jgi:hypothetical protein